MPAPKAWFVGSSDRGMRVAQEDGLMTHKNGTGGTLYHIVVGSELSDRYAIAFEGMKMVTKDGRTILRGEVIDDSHLHGILDRIGALGLKLESLQALAEEAHASAERDREPKP
jgi:hypothetical protein